MWSNRSPNFSQPFVSDVSAGGGDRIEDILSVEGTDDDDEERW